MFPGSEHSSRQYDADLENIRSRVLQMGGLAEQQVTTVIAALQANSPEQFKQVIAADQPINSLEISLDASCVEIIARRQPAANDLRMILAVVKAITDLERVGDEASKIARTGIDLMNRQTPQVPCLPDLRIMAEKALQMLHNALDAYARLDTRTAGAVIGQDDEIDERFRAIQRLLLTHMMEDARSIGAALDVTFMAKSLERIGDHAKNIAEYVVYMVKGTDIRHSPREAVEETLRS
jgi:phosphate transport system protein